MIAKKFPSFYMQRINRVKVLNLDTVFLFHVPPLKNNKPELLAPIAAASFCDEARRAKDIAESGTCFEKKRKSSCSPL